jgi:hypothetical protein
VVLPAAIGGCRLNLSRGYWNGAARDVFVQSTPLSWSAWGAEILGWFFDSCERDLYGEEYHREMERYRQEFWENRGIK